MTFDGAGRAELEEFDLPPLTAGQVLIRNAYSVISPGTERAWMLGLPNTPVMQVTMFSALPLLICFSHPYDTQLWQGAFA